MKREAIVETAEAYLRQWNGCTAKVQTVVRYSRTAALVSVTDGDARWGLRIVGGEVVEDSLPASEVDRMLAHMVGMG